MQRVEVHLYGEPLWFESADATLDLAPEVLACALLLPCAMYGRPPPVVAPLDSQWLGNARRVLDIARAWWGYPADPGKVLRGLRPRTAAVVAAPAHGRGTALCFSGGVDSFHTLLRGSIGVDCILYVHGFDLPLDRRGCADEFRRSLERIAQVVQARPVVVRTNLREHSLLRASHWEQVHGGALAAIGHLLAASIAELLVSASYPRELDHPWGSHWRLDPLWSTESVRITHVGAEQWRASKLLEMVDEPLVQQHLRVCLYQRERRPNCGRCEKCIRTMLILEAVGRLRDFCTLPGPGALPAAIDALSGLRPDLELVYRPFVDQPLAPAIRDAVARLLERCRPVPAGGRAAKDATS